MQKEFRVSRSAARVVSGIVEGYADDPRYAKAIAAAEAEVAIYFNGGLGAQKHLQRLLKVLRLNAANQKRYGAGAMIARYELPLSESTFQRIRARYIYRIASELELVQGSKKETKHRE